MKEQVSVDKMQCPTCGSWACWPEDSKRRISVYEEEYERLKRLDENIQKAIQQCDDAQYDFRNVRPKTLKAYLESLYETDNQQE